MGCVCCSLSTFISIVLHAFERITLCTVCAMLVCCLLFTILGVLIMGIGIGFHYCEVKTSVDAMAEYAKADNVVDEKRRSGAGAGDSKVLRTVNQAVKRGVAHRLGRRDRADQLMPSNNNTINDLILARNLSSTNSTIRRKRDLTSDGSESITINASLLFDYDNMKRNTTNEVDADGYVIPQSNVSIYGASLLKENCTLWNFFTRFF